MIYVSDLSFVGSQYLDRYLVTLFLGLQLAGVYFLYWSVASAVSTFVSIVVFQIQRPRLIKAYHDGGALAHRQLTAKFMKTAISATAAFSIAVGCAFYIVLPLLKQSTSIADHLAVFWLIMAGMALRNISDFGGMALFTSHRDHMMTLTNLAAVIALMLAQATVAAPCRTIRSWCRDTFHLFSNDILAIQASVQPLTDWDATQSTTLDYLGPLRTTCNKTHSTP